MRYCFVNLTESFCYFTRKWEIGMYSILVRYKLVLNVPFRPIKVVFQIS